ncbi:MAG: hypothetical protein ACREOZ_04515 [Gloeomargaritales cyanobacterium]
MVLTDLSDDDDSLVDIEWIFDNILHLSDDMKVILASLDLDQPSDFGTMSIDMLENDKFEGLSIIVKGRINKVIQFANRTGRTI